MEALFKIWSRPVHVQTVVGETATLLSYDGSAHRERTFDTSNAA
jgi:hypothetical protein